ncbi:MAG: penicillin-binding protein activator [Alphaproteobacteria bacterium]
MFRRNLKVSRRALSGAIMGQATGEVLGTGTVRVAMLLPRSASGNAGTTGLAFRNATDLAIRDFPNAGIQVVIYDTGGTADGARQAAGTALREGAEIFLGPIFSSSVKAITPQARRAGVPVVAFSSDPSAASPGVYLLSFTPGNDIRRIIAYSASQGRKSFAGLLPSIAQGAIAEAAFRETSARVGGRIVAIQRYELDQQDIRTKATTMAELAGQIDALLIADAGDAVPLIADIITNASANVAQQKVKLLGNGQWDDPRVLNDPDLRGGWFAGPDNSGFSAFARRYASAFGGQPPRQASLAYDATVLAAGLVRQFGANRFSRSVLTNPNGFSGIDGVFRFRNDGVTERQLAVYEVTGSGLRVIDPAPKSFTGGGF